MCVEEDSTLLHVLCVLRKTVLLHVLCALRMTVLFLRFVCAVGRYEYSSPFLSAAASSAYCVSLSLQLTPSVCFYRTSAIFSLSKPVSMTISWSDRIVHVD